MLSDLPTVSFVVPTFKRPDALAETMDALLQVTYPNELREVIVVDNADDPSTALVVQAKASGAAAIRYEVQRKPGAAAARNSGARIATGELLIFCDDDIVVEPSHVRLHLETHSRHAHCATNGSWQFSPSAMEALRASPFGRYRLALEDHFRENAPSARRLEDGCWEMPALSACNLAVSGDLFWKLGGFDETFPFAGAEDQEFSSRAAAAGLRLIRNDEIGLLHNDQTITFAQFCTREERSAQTAAVLVSKESGSRHGQAFLAVNGPLTFRDPPRLMVKKLIKRVLAVPPLPQACHRLIHVAEVMRVPDPLLRSMYAGIVGVHIQRGFRRGL